MVLILKTNFCAKQESQTNMELEKQENLFFSLVANWLSFVEQKGKKEEVRATVDDVSSEEEVVDRQCMEIGPLDEVENQHCVSVGAVMKERKILKFEDSCKPNLHLWWFPGRSERKEEARGKIIQRTSGEEERRRRREHINRRWGCWDCDGGWMDESMLLQGSSIQSAANANSWKGKTRVNEIPLSSEWIMWCFISDGILQRGEGSYCRRKITRRGKN